MGSSATSLSEVGPSLGSDVETESDRVRALFVRHRREVNRLVYRLLGPDGDHDDIVQDVFVRLVSRAGSLRERERESAWVASVTVNVVRNQLRRRRVRRVVELRAELPEPGIDPEPRLLQRDLARRGHLLLDRLDPAERIALLLRRVEQRSLEEVASMCGCSLSTAKRRIKRSERRLAALLEEHPDLYDDLRAYAGGEP